MKTAIKPVNRLAKGNGESPSIGITLPKIDYQTIQLTVRGKSPLIVHAWSAKAVRMMLDKQMGIATSGREKKDPLKDFKESLYYLPENKGMGVPSPAFKACIVSGANDVDLKMTEIKRAVHVDFYLTPVIAPPLPESLWTDWDRKYVNEIKQEHAWGVSMRMDLAQPDATLHNLNRIDLPTLNRTARTELDGTGLTMTTPNTPILNATAITRLR